MALALYRRYRPDTFEGVIGQDQVTVPLMRALDEHKLTHAYLFSGPRGCGKTSSARILARCVNCEQGPTSHPCGECESCRDLATGGPGSIDVVEIDAASHNGVDDARELRERAGFAPARDRYKIFILDEAHMVTPQGFNALLKIVEEPPEHVMFIFATTEPDKVIGTIRSRTHHYPFRLVPQEIMGPYLEQVCDNENIEAEPGVLRLAMRSGGGSVRDTLSVLDQLMVGAVDGEISYDSAVALLGFTPDALIGEAVDAVADKNGEALYGVIQKVVVGGFDPRRFVEDLLSRVRDLLVLTLGGERAESVLSDDAAAENMDDLRRQASSLGLAALTSMADTINATLANMNGAISPRMRLELLAARLLAGREQNSGSVAPTGDAPTSGMPVPVVSGDSAQSVSRPSMAGSRRRASQGASAQPVPAQPAATQPVRSVQPSAAPTNVADTVASGAASVLAAVEQAMGSSEGDMQFGTDVASTAVSAPAAQDNRNPDEKWDAIVAGLPDDVRRYVDRTKVPRVLFDEKSNRLWIKFDKALSKYAFAKAVAKEEVDGTNDVVKILRAEVHKTFGPQVTLMPAKKLGDGTQAIPWNKLSPEEQSKINAQLVQEQLKAATLLTANLGNASSFESGEKSDERKSQEVGESTDEEAHRGRSNTFEDETDPWGVTAPKPVSQPMQQADAQPNEWSDAQPNEQQVARPASAPASQFAPVEEDDPWGAPMAPIAEPANSVQSFVSTASAMPENQPSAEDDPWASPSVASAVSAAQAVQSPSMEDDPWGAPMPVQTGPDESESRPAPESARESARHEASSGQPHHGQRHDMRGEAGNPAVNPAANDPWNGQFAQAEPVKPQVAAEDDEYSMSDESLGQSTALSTDDLKRLFEVKKVEEFKADDPKNPLNVQHKKSLDT